MIDGGDSDSRTLFLMGLAHHWDRHYTQAAGWLRRAEAASPPYPPAAHFLGWALYHAGRPDESRAAFERHLQMAPDEGDSHFGLGVLALERGDFDAAERFLQRAIALQQEDPSRAAGVAKALARLSEVREQRDGDRQAAAALLARAVAADQDLYEAHYQLARLLRHLGRMAAAEAAEAAGRAAEQRVTAARTRP
jgi:Flp pilus assembly protein TadD